MKLPLALEELISRFGRLPGIGPKTAQRLAFYMISASADYVNDFANKVREAKEKVRFCQECFGVSEGETCSICGDEKRRKNLICVVERSTDVVALEAVGGFEGRYHVLGGLINPLDHIGPEDIKIEELVGRLQKLGDEEIEIILALNPTMEGEATTLYIKKKLESPKSPKSFKVTRIGNGLPMGADLGFADQATLSRAMEGRREV
ncbi:MAG: recombination mediator RecR [Candidatus Shapirobacteria bacterium]|jgi:recombination protein RecR